MYKEILLQYAQFAEYGKPRPGADENDIRQAEKTAGCPLPAELRALVQEMNGDGYLFLSTDEMTEAMTRSRTMLGEEYEGLDLLLFFAANGCGDYYCYKILPSGVADPSLIYIWMHEDNELGLAAHGIPELIDRYFHDEI